jgi:hypothetical protein
MERRRWLLCWTRSAFGRWRLAGRRWRRDPESNRARRICNPLHNRFAIAPSWLSLTLTRKGSLSFPFLRCVWSGKRDSNSRPQPWQGCALPTELFPHGASCDALCSSAQVSVRYHPLSLAVYTAFWEGCKRARTQCRVERHLPKGQVASSRTHKPALAIWAGTALGSVRSQGVSVHALARSIGHLVAQHKAGIACLPARHFQR